MPRNSKTTNPDEGTIGHRLMTARINAGYKFAKDFSSGNNIPDNSYYCHESNRRKPRDETLQFYARLLGVSYEWLRSGGDTAPRKVELPSIPVRRYLMTQWSDESMEPYSAETLEGHVLKGYPLSQQFAVRAVTDEFAPLLDVNSWGLCAKVDWQALSYRDYIGLIVRERHKDAPDLSRSLVYIPLRDGSGLHVPATSRNGKGVDLSKNDRLSVEGVIIATIQMPS